MKRKMMTKKKILIGSIFAALLMVSMPFISALQNTQVATSTTTKSVQPSNLAATTATNINSIISLSANPETATPEQMINIIQLSIKVLNDNGYTAEAASFNQQLQTILSLSGQWGTARCALVWLTVQVLGWLLVITAAQGYLLMLVAAYMFFNVRYTNHCAQISVSTTGCSLCGDTTGPATPMPSN